MQLPQARAMPKIPTAALAVSWSAWRRAEALLHRDESEIYARSGLHPGESHTYCTSTSTLLHCLHILFTSIYTYHTVILSRIDKNPGELRVGHSAGSGVFYAHLIVFNMSNARLSITIPSVNSVQVLLFEGSTQDLNISTGISILRT